MNTILNNIVNSPKSPSMTYVAKENTVLDYHPFGMLMPGRDASASQYRYGFNSMEKDDEIKGEGNSYDFGARIYDPRIGRWLSMDAIAKSFITPYNFAANNPIIFIDPEGKTDFYFNGKFIGTDGVDNNLIGVVHSKDVKKDIKKGDFSKLVDLKNGTLFTGGFTIDKEVLKVATKIAAQAYSEKGKDREFGTSLTKTEDGYTQNEVNEGDPVNLDKYDPAHVTIPDGDISIHTHPTGTGEYGHDNTPSTKEGLGEHSDENIFPDYGMNIIIGNSKIGHTVHDENTNLTKTDQGTKMITIYGNSKDKLIGGLPKEAADDIIEDQSNKTKNP